MIVNLLIIAAILTLAGAFMWMKPSPRDRHLSELRTAALGQGLKLHSLRLPDTSMEGRLAERRELRTLYRLPHVFDRDSGPCFTVLRTSGVASAFLPDGWVWADQHRPDEAERTRLHDFLAELPEAYDLIDARPDGVSLGWDERAGTEALPAVRETLQRLVGLLSP